MSLEKLKKKYDKMKVDQVISKTSWYLKSSKTARKKFIESLLYLKHTSRFREVPQYKNSTFIAFISDQFNLRETTFNNEVKAFVRYPKIAEAFGPGVVVKIERKCGAQKTAEVAKQIEKASKESKAPLKREDIDGIIEKNAKPVKEKPAKPSVGAMKKEIDHKMAAIVDKDKTILEQSKQIEKLKETVKAKNAMIASLREELQGYKNPTIDFLKNFSDTKPVMEVGSYV